MTTKRPPKLPSALPFDGIGACYWSGPLEWRCPNKGDWYVSGAIPEAYRARQHLTTEYWCGLKPTHYAKTVTTTVRGDPVRLTAYGMPLPRHTAS